MAPRSLGEFAAGRVGLRNDRGSGLPTFAGGDLDVEPAFLIVGSQAAGNCPALRIAPRRLRAHPSIENAAWSGSRQLEHDFRARHRLVALIAYLHHGLGRASRFNLVYRPFAFHNYDFERARLLNQV